MKAFFPILPPNRGSQPEVIRSCCAHHPPPTTHQRSSRGRLKGSVRLGPSVSGYGPSLGTRRRRRSLTSSLRARNIRHARASSVAGERVDWCANSAPAPRAELTRAHLATTEPDPHAHEPAARPDRVPDELIHGGSVSLELSSCRRRRPHGGTPPPARHATGERTLRAPPRSNRRAPLPAAAPARRVHGGLLAPPPPGCSAGRPAAVAPPGPDPVGGYCLRLQL